MPLNSITTEKRDENSSENSGSEEEQSGITTAKMKSKIKSIPGLYWSMTQRPRSGNSTMRFYKRFSWGIATKLKQSRKPLKKF